MINSFFLVRYSTTLVLTSFLLLTLLSCSGERYTELMNASRDGNNDAVNRALDRGVEINERTSQGKTALMLAASNGHTETVALLIKRGADPLLADVYETTPITIASTAGKTDVVALLVKHGADTTTKDTSGGSALDNATFYGHTETVKALLAGTKSLTAKHGAELLLIASGLGLNKIVEEFLKYGVSPNGRGVKQRTPLMAAAAFDQPIVIQTLLTHQADATLKDYKGKTALDIATKKDNKEVMALLSKYANKVAAE